MTRYATIIGCLFLLIGILGFFGAFTPNERLFGLFAVDTPHNLIHVISGLLGIWAGTSHDWSRAMSYGWFLIIAYGLITLLGFVLVPNEGMLFNALHINRADNFLHLAVTASALLAVMSERRHRRYST